MVVRPRKLILDWRYWKMKTSRETIY